MWQPKQTKTNTNLSDSSGQESGWVAQAKIKEPAERCSSWGLREALCPAFPAPGGTRIPQLVPLRHVTSQHSVLCLLSSRCLPSRGPRAHTGRPGNQHSLPSSGPLCTSASLELCQVACSQVRGLGRGHLWGRYSATTRGEGASGCEQTAFLTLNPQASGRLSAN